MARSKWKKYEEIRGSISSERRWFDDFFAGQSIEVETHSWGSVVSYAETPHEILMILEGQAEICEEYFIEGKDFDISYRGARAYRPIRIVEKGDVLGDFSVIDEAVGLGEHSRPGERWEIVFGARSAIFLAKTKLSDEFADKYLMGNNKIPGTERIDKNLAYGEHNFLKNAKKTVEVARFNVAQLPEDKRSDFCNTLMAKTSWKRAYTYRTCPNSYNFQEKLKFIYGCKAILGKYDATKLRKINGGSNDISYRLTIDIFLEALYDAINRPFRQEPVYAHCDAIVAEYPNANQFTRCLFPMRVSKREDIDDFYFPIGLLNFQVANHAALMDRKVIFRNAFLNEREGQNGSVFWGKICNEILDFHRKLPNSVQDIVYWDKKLVKDPKKDELAAEWSNRFSSAVIRSEKSGLFLKAEVLTTALLGKQVFLKYSRKKPSEESDDS